MTRTVAGTNLNSVEATQTSLALEPGTPGRMPFSSACVQVTAAAPLTATKPKVIVLGLDGFVVETPLVLLPKHHAEFWIPGEACRPLPQLGLERRGVLAEGVVEKSHLPRRPRADRPAGQGQLQRPPPPHPPRQRIGPVFRSIETAHALVMGVEDDARPRIDVVRRERQHCAAGSGIAAQHGDDEM